MDGWILSLALSVIRAVIKNPRKKEKLREAMMKLRDAIDAAFAPAPGVSAEPRE
jgi:hypothetical protein